MEFNLVKSLNMRQNGFNQSGLNHYAVTRLEGVINFSHPRRAYGIPALAAEFCTTGTGLLALAYEDGYIQFRNVLSKDVTNGFFEQIHRNAIFDICWVEGEHKLLTASGDQSVMLVEFSNSMGPIILKEFKGHYGSVRRVTACPNSPNLFSTGGRDGRIAMWDARTREKENVIDRAHNSSSFTSSILGLKYIDEYHLLSCGNRDSFIKVWDVRKISYAYASTPPLPLFKLENPTKTKTFIDISIDPNGGQFYATSTCSRIYKYRNYTAEPEGWFEGAYIKGTYIRTSLSPDGEYLISGSYSDCAHIWPTNNNKKCVQPLVTLGGHTDAVTAVAWATVCKEPVIITCSDNYQELIWRMYDKNKPPYPEYVKAEIISYPTTSKFHTRNLTADPDLIPAQENTPAKVVPALLTMTPPQLQTPGCRQLFPRDHDGNCYDSSPAAFLQNLPNFNVDGISPHNLASPQQVNHKENINWLTEMGKKHESEEKPKIQKSGKKHPNGSGSGKKRKGKSLLQYFPKVSKNDGD